MHRDCFVAGITNDTLFSVSQIWTIHLLRQQITGWRANGFIFIGCSADFFDYRRDAKRVPVAILLLDFRLCSSKISKYQDDFAVLNIVLCIAKESEPLVKTNKQTNHVLKF